MKLKDKYLLREFNGTIYAITEDVPADKKNDPIILNVTGRLLWQLLTSDTDKASLVNALLSEYEIDKNTAEADTEKFIEELRAADLLTEA
ncbi:MAG: PqqD family protein [Clostridia bacterium]|nr:PqqD family protein [Clostridia bacterium]